MTTEKWATRLDGSLGKEKEHYHLKKIKASSIEIMGYLAKGHTKINPRACLPSKKSRLGTKNAPK
ncbi:MULTISPECIES: hypothetical protein [Arenibacter]|uniref:hypothetical protein n=1 Tax=Arenibacter TaxID=178469 RepID=UPI001864B375|nr:MULTISPECIES: hypothetical protein [Arenibacter]